MFEYPEGMEFRFETYPAPPGVTVSLVEHSFHGIVSTLASEVAMTALAEMLGRAPQWSDFAVVETCGKAELEPAGQLMLLSVAERLTSFLAAETMGQVVEFAGAVENRDYRRDQIAAKEVGHATRRTEGSAAAQIAFFRRLVQEFPDFPVALRAGEISLTHCRIVDDETRDTEDREALRRIAHHALIAAHSQTPGAFRRTVRMLVKRYDKDAAARRRRAQRRRGVTFLDHGDGLTSMNLTGRTEEMAAVRSRLDEGGRQLQAADKAAHEKAVADARAAGAEPPARDRLTSGQAMSDAAVALLIGTVDAEGTVVYNPRSAMRICLELVMDVATLEGRTDGVARLGDETISAETARELLELAESVRPVTVDAMGSMLDYGSEVYLPGRQRRHVGRRDRFTCRCCGRKATRGEMDHIVEFLRGGPTASWNCGWTCPRCHQLKTDGLLHVEGRADDELVFTTPSGLVFVSLPPPYLEDPERDVHRWGHQPPVGFTVTPRPWAPPPPGDTASDASASGSASDDSARPAPPRPSLLDRLRNGPPGDHDPDEVPPF
jgi:hypothetical protein